MLPLVAKRQDDIAALCRRYHVRRLDIFGSAARGDDFDPARSDIDFIVEYQQEGTSLGAFLSLRDGLRDLLDRNVDLTMANAVRNPFIRADIDRTRQIVYVLPPQISAPWSL